MNKGIFILSTLILIIIGLVLIVHSSYFEIKEIQVIGNQKLKTEQIIEASGISVGQNIVLLPGREIANRLMNYVRIKGVKLEPCFPDKMVLHINERIGLGLLLTEDGKWIELSHDGQILETFDTFPRTDNTSSLPLVEGIVPKLNGTEVEMTYDLIYVLDLLKALLPIKNKVSKVSYQADDIKVVLYSQTTINFGQAMNLEKNIEYFYKIWDYLNDIEENIEEKIECINLRYEGKPFFQRKS